MERDFLINVFDGESIEYVVNLREFGKDVVRFGRSSDNDIVLRTDLVSKQHGYFRWEGGRWAIYDNGSTNGIFWNRNRIKRKGLADGDKLIIGYEQTSYRVAFICSHGSRRDVYEHFRIAGMPLVTIGRARECSICVQHTAVLRYHCRIVSDGQRYYLEGVSRQAQVQYNGMPLEGRQPLSEMDRFVVGDTMFIYQSGVLHYTKKQGGLGFEVSHLSKIVGKGSKRKRINTDINLTVNAGEFVAIIGGSGAGKSTLLNCLCGCSEISEGNVIINGEDLASNYNSLKQLIGYVPQQDIVYDNLKLERMLYYTAKLRMPPDSTKEEIDARITEALRMVELTDKRDVMIKSLSGGQKKRASIAVELLSDPKLFFLDEPTSGLDPGTERNLMGTLKNMTKYGKTVVLVTHTPLNLHLCDKIIVMGYGGRLCFCGRPNEAEQFFRVKNLVDIYNLVNNNAEAWALRFAQASGVGGNPIIKQQSSVSKMKVPSMRQFGILVGRYVELQLHDMKRLLLQLLMAPGLGILLYIAFRNANLFVEMPGTQKLSLTLACCAFWIGLFNTIQEICKERQIYTRERMANLKLIPYIGSKLFVNGILAFAQSLLLLGVVALTLGMPDEGMMLTGAPFMEMFITTYLTMLSALCMGLMVSAIVGNSDQAISLAPILLIPQILFSGVIVELGGAISKISYIISCRHSCVAYCTTENINNLVSGKTIDMGMGPVEVPVDRNELYDFEAKLSIFGGELDKLLTNPVMLSWGALLVLSAVCIDVALISLKSRKFS